MDRETTDTAFRNPSPKHITVQFEPTGEILSKRSIKDAQSITVSRVSNAQLVSSLVTKVFSLCESDTVVLAIDGAILPLEDIVQECQMYILEGSEPWFPVQSVAGKVTVNVKVTV
jgi:hypothetical protein